MRATVGANDSRRAKWKGRETKTGKERESLWGEWVMRSGSLLMLQWVIAPLLSQPGNEWLSMGEKLQARVLAESDTLHALPDCFSHSPYWADPLYRTYTASLHRYIVAGQWTALCVNQGTVWKPKAEGMLDEFMLHVLQVQMVGRR